jgi:uncharacterized protein (DUF302 family)
MAPYHFSVTLHEPFELAAKKTREALIDHGFHIVSEIDLAGSIEEKLGVPHDPYLILTASNAGFARRAIGHDPAIGVLFPAKVVVRSEGDDSVVINFMDPAAMVQLVGHEPIQRIADELRTRLEMTRDAIATA